MLMSIDEIGGCKGCHELSPCLKTCLKRAIVTIVFPSLFCTALVQTLESGTIHGIIVLFVVWLAHPEGKQ
jgi:hypothetical protein